MLTLGVIVAIDNNSNKCDVRLPIFENSNSEEVIISALVSNTPGLFNGYKVDDRVVVGFIDNAISRPVIIGKMYLGYANEIADPRGALNCNSAVIDENAEIPITTKISSESALNKPNISGTAPSDLQTIINNSINTSSGNFDVEELRRIFPL